MKKTLPQAVDDDGLYASIRRRPVTSWMTKVEVSADPKTYFQRAPPGIGSSSASWTRARYPVRVSSQSASLLNKGFLLLARGPELLELDADLRVGIGRELHVQGVHRTGGDLIAPLPREREVAVVAGAEEALAIPRQADRAAQVGALGRERDDLRFRSGGLADQPDGADRLARIFHPGVLALVDDGERLRDPL